MYAKNNFSNYFVLATILFYALGCAFDQWHTVIYRDYSSINENLQAAIIGLYSLFYENGFLNANPYYQVFVATLVTSYQVTYRIDCFAPQFHFYAYHSGPFLGMLALVLYNKLPKVLTYILRYEIGFSILSYILAFKPPYDHHCYDTNIPIVAGLSIVFIFIPYFTFDRIVFYSSISLFSHMVTRALLLLISYIPNVHHRILFDILAFNITIGAVFAAALGYQYMNNRSQGVLLGSDTRNYGTIEAED
jgi:hypothetical protein